MKSELSKKLSVAIARLRKTGVKLRTKVQWKGDRLSEHSQASEVEIRRRR